MIESVLLPKESGGGLGSSEAKVFIFMKTMQYPGQLTSCSIV